MWLMMIRSLCFALHANWHRASNNFNCHCMGGGGSWSVTFGQTNFACWCMALYFNWRSSKPSPLSEPANFAGGWLLARTLIMLVKPKFHHPDVKFMHFLPSVFHFIPCSKSLFSWSHQRNVGAWVCAMEKHNGALGILKGHAGST